MNEDFPKAAPVSVFALIDDRDWARWAPQDRKISAEFDGVLPQFGYWESPPCGSTA